MAKQAQVDADAAAAATARAKAAEDRAAAAERALEARADVPIFADVPVPGAREATAALDALRAQAAPRSPARAAPKSPAKSHKKGQSPRVHRRPVVCFFPPKSAPRRRRSPLKENSPVVRAVKAVASSPKRAVKAVASSLDARARKIKDERIARAKAQRNGGAPHTDVPVAKRTRGYKIL